MSSVALLLPGQGAQAVGMGKAFYDQFDDAKEIYRTANRKLGFDVTALCFEGPAEDLTKTEKCQPALFVTSLAAYVVFLRQVPKGFKPVAAAGLSLGELTALAVAEALSLEDALYVVKARGEAMAECAARNKGTMLAVLGLTEQAIAPVCKESGATAANFNAPDQIVLSGTEEAIQKAEGLAKAAGAKRAVKLDVAGAFHSALMQPAADACRQVLAKVALRPPKFPVISNVTAQPVEDPEVIRRILAEQIVSPVRWDASVRFMRQAGAAHFIEFPPAKVLTGLLKRIDATAKGYALNEPKDLASLSEALGTPVPTQ